jgi:hypothetical protein
MLNNPTLVKVLEDNNKLDSFNETVSGFGSNHTGLYKYLNGLDKTQSKAFSNMVDSINGPGNAPDVSDDKKEKVDIKIYTSNLPYPEGDIELGLYSLAKARVVGKGEYYAAFKIRGVENFESNTYDLKYGNQKIEVKQTPTATSPNEPAMKGKLHKMKTYGEMLTVLVSLQRIEDDEDWISYYSDKPDLKGVMDKLHDNENENLDKILSGEITATSTTSKKQDDSQKKFTLIRNLFIVLNKYRGDMENNFSDNYSIRNIYDHPYVKSYKEGLLALKKDMDSVWKRNKDGSLKDIFVLLFVDKMKKVFYGPGSVIFPARSKFNKGGNANNTNISQGGVRFYKNPELTEKEIQRLQELAGINK